MTVLPGPVSHDLGPGPLPRALRGWCTLGVALLVVMLPSVAAADGKPHPGASGRFHRAVCSRPSPGYAGCLAQLVTDARGVPLATPATTPPGYGPADLQNAYNLAQAAASGPGTTVAIVDAYDAPSAESDLGVYRSTYGLPACTTANGCFRKVNQSGVSNSPPPSDSGWAQEISLDVDMVSAICPSCKILLVEANSSYMTDLGSAVNTAVRLGASAVSNSYGGSEYSSETSDEASYYHHPGVDITVSSGDSGYGAQFPAASQYVSAVGGTSLSHSSNSRGWSESAWSGAGSGCSAFIAKPTWQSDGGCSQRTIADLSAVADPNTGVAVYNAGSWMVFGGTSVASPIAASVDALAGGRATSSPFGSFPYSHQSQFFDVSAGSNGSCSVAYLCNGVAGYDGPTGWGTPNGAGVPPSPIPPVNTTPPTINGSDVQGQTLTASTGGWNNSPTSYAYQWQSCSSSCTPVGTNASTYVLQSTDLGSTINVIVTATNSAGSASATSAPTPTVSGPPADFSLSSTPSATLRRGGTTTYAVKINAINGFTSAVTLRATGLHSGVSSTWSTNPATPAQTPTTLKLTATSRATTGTYTITISGASGSSPTITRSVTATLKVTR